jgi:hypothetical protein
MIIITIMNITTTLFNFVFVFSVSPPTLSPCSHHHPSYR